MAFRHDTQLENTGLPDRETSIDAVVLSPKRPDEPHARRLLRTLGDYLGKEIARHMSD